MPSKTPIEVAEELTVAARLLANVLRRLDTSDWELRLIYNWPQRTERTLRWVAASSPEATSPTICVELGSGSEQFTSMLAVISVGGAYLRRIEVQ